MFFIFALIYIWMIKGQLIGDRHKSQPSDLKLTAEITINKV